MPYGRPRRRRRKSVWLTLAALLVAAVAAYFHVPLHLPRTGDTSAVSARFIRCHSHAQQDCVVDGDTIHLGTTIIRIEDIDTPETHRAGCPEEAALGEKATERMMDLLNAGPFDVVNNGPRDTDKYGRKLRLIERDGKSLGAILIEEKLAHPWVGHKLPWCS